MKTFFWSTWTRRDMSLLALAIILLIGSLVTGAKWLDFASTAAFAGSCFCWGAGYIESRKSAASK